MRNGARAVSPQGPAEGKGGVGLAARLRGEALAFVEREATYLAYAGQAREALVAMATRRRAEGLPYPGDPSEALLAQLQGLKARFDEVDSVVRSLLLQVQDREAVDPEQARRLTEEFMAGLNALVGIELEARAAQTRHALAAVLRDYLDGHAVQTRTVTLEVERELAKGFHGLTSQVRDRAARLFGRHDRLSHKDLFARLVAMGQANPDLLAHMGAPTFLPQRGES